MRGKRGVCRLVVPVLLLAACGGPGPDTGSTGATVTPVVVAPQPRDSITIAAAGDLLVHPPLTAQAAADARAAGRPGHDFTQVLAGVAPIVATADLGICHMETPLAKPEGPFTGFPIFSVPPELADAAAGAGFDTCSTASNHSLDTGLEGVSRTLGELDRVGLKHTGTARDADEAARPNVLDVHGVKVGHLSYTFSFNGIPQEPGTEWSANLIEPKAILAAARRAKAAGAEIVVLSLQWGTEYQNAADDGQLGLARQLLASPDVDLIVGHHVHVVQPFEKVGTEWVAYGLGNLTTRFPDGSPENTQDAAVPVFTFTRTGAGWTVTDVTVHPTFMEYAPAARVVDLSRAAADPAVVAEKRADYARIHRRITGYLDMLGARAAGLRIA
jgi:poly-gamma-glutamate synthesis protein (capsule biosynthesis protein)